MNTSLIVLVSLGVLTGDDMVAPSGARVKQAVEASLVYLQEESVDWIRDRKCASCHHAAMTIWAVNEARSRGFRIDAEALGELTRFTFDDPVRSKMLPASSPPGAGASAGTASSLPSVYAAIAGASVPPESLSAEARMAQERLRDHLIREQRADGTWVHGGGRPPMLESEEIVTLMTLLALPASGDTASDVRAKAIAWLEKTPPGSFQGELLRLLVDSRSGARPGQTAGRIHAILERQNPDGGWSQTPGMTSDAYATGLALYVLGRAGVELDRAEIGRARGFLVRTQDDDGSWPMTSRPATAGGEPAKDLRPITAAGTAWATLGLLESSSR